MFDSFFEGEYNNNKDIMENNERFKILTLLLSGIVVTGVITMFTSTTGIFL